MMKRDLIFHRIADVLLLVVSLISLAAELQAEVFASQCVADTLISPLAQEGGVEQVWCLAFQPVLVLGIGIGKRPDGDNALLCLGNILEVGLEDGLVGVALCLVLGRRGRRGAERDVKLGDADERE